MILFLELVSSIISEFTSAKLRVWNTWEGRWCNVRGNVECLGSFCSTFSPTFHSSIAFLHSFLTRLLQHWKKIRKWEMLRNGGSIYRTVIGGMKHSISHIVPLCNTCIICVWTDALALHNIWRINPISLDGFYLDLQIMLLESILLFFLGIHFTVCFLKDV